MSKVNYQEKYQHIVDKLLELDKTGNIYSIELQSDNSAYAEINVIFYDFDTITEELWDYTMSFYTPQLIIDVFDKSQEIPRPFRILYRKES